MRAVAAVLALLLLGGCGGGQETEGATAPESTPATTASSSEPAAPPAYVENETCRTGMAPLIDIFLANDTDSLAYGTFDNRVNQLTKMIDAAIAPCSPKVSSPLTKAMYKFTLARVQWGIGTCEDECIRKVTANLRAGISLARKAQSQLETTV